MTHFLYEMSEIALLVFELDLSPSNPLVYSVVTMSHHMSDAEN